MQENKTNTERESVEATMVLRRESTLTVRCSQRELLCGNIVVSCVNESDLVLEVEARGLQFCPHSGWLWLLGGPWRWGAELPADENTGSFLSLFRLCIRT